MSDRMLRELWGMIVAGVVLCSALAAAWNRSVATSVLVGGMWNVASLWCLAHLLRAWLGPQPSQRRTIGWLLVKFPLLYVAVIALLRSPAMSAVGFGIGFTVVLLIAMAWFARTLHHKISPHS